MPTITLHNGRMSGLGLCVLDAFPPFVRVFMPSTTAHRVTFTGSPSHHPRGEPSLRKAEFLGCAVVKYTHAAFAPAISCDISGAYTERVRRWRRSIRFDQSNVASGIGQHTAAKRCHRLFTGSELGLSSRIGCPLHHGTGCGSPQRGWNNRSATLYAGHGSAHRLLLRLSHGLSRANRLRGFDR